jgi:hypothetical protein
MTADMADDCQQMAISSSGSYCRFCHKDEPRDKADTRLLAKTRINRYHKVEGGARDTHVTPETYKVN